MVLEVRQHQDFEQLLERSKTNPVLIFKHSTQCDISAQAYYEFTRFAEKANELTCGLVLVLEYRDLSNAIADELDVEHKSPQAIVIKNGKPVWSASHWAITADALAQALYAEPTR